jgi:hypothetical protein
VSPLPFPFPSGSSFLFIFQFSHSLQFSSNCTHSLRSILIVGQYDSSARRLHIPSTTSHSLRSGSSFNKPSICNS